MSARGTRARTLSVRLLWPLRMPPDDRRERSGLQSQNASLERESEAPFRFPASGDDGSCTARFSRCKSSADFARHPSVIGKLLHRKVAASIGSLQVCREDRDADAGNRCRDVPQDGALRPPRTGVAGRHAVRVDTVPVSASGRCPQIRRSTPARCGESGQEDAQGRSPALRGRTIAGPRDGGVDDAGTRIVFGRRIERVRSSYRESCFRRRNLRRQSRSKTGDVPARGTP